MRSKRRFFAWLLTVVMVVSLMSNQYMIVTKAEETQSAYSIQEALALDSTKEVAVDGEATSVQVNPVWVSLPCLTWDEDTQTYVTNWNDTSATLYKVKVPANSAVKLVYEYTGELIDGIDGYNSYQVSVYSFDEQKYISSIVNTTDTNYGYSSQCGIIRNDTASEVSYLIAVSADSSDCTALRATSPVSYTNATEINASQGSVNITGDSYLVEYPTYDMMLGTTVNYVNGIMYKVDIPEDGTYGLKLKYEGTQMMAGVVNASIYREYDEMGQTVLSSYNSFSISAAVTENGVNFNSGINYILLNNDIDDWSNVSIEIAKLETIAALKDSAVTVSGEGKYTGKVTDKAYVTSGGSSAKGILYAVKLEPNTGYKLKYEGDYFVTDQDMLGTSIISSAWGGALSVYNGEATEKTYYVWTNEYYDEEGNPLPLVVDKMQFVSDFEATKLTIDGTKHNIVSADNEVAYLTEFWDMGICTIRTEMATGNVYSVEIPANSKYILQLDYVGSEFIDDYCTINSNVSILDGDLHTNSMNVSNQHDTMSDYYYKSAQVALDNSYNETSKTMYIIAGGQWTEGDIQLSITEYPNITQLMSKAEDITGKTSYTGTVSDSSYEFVWDYDGNKGDSRGGLQKVTVPAGKTKSFNVTSGFQGVIYKETDGVLAYDSQIYGTDFNITNSSTEDLTYYVWLYTYDEYITSYDISLIQNVMYRVHSQSYGWMDWNSNGSMAGTTGQEKRLESFEIKLADDSIPGGVRYTAHVQSYGWLAEYTDPETWTTMDGMSCGTAGESKRIETICIDLYGDMAEAYDIYYRVSTNKLGWLDWAKNGERAGTAGFATAIEAMQVTIVPKGVSLDEMMGGFSSSVNLPYVEYGDIPVISQLTASATDASAVGSYTASVTQEEYYHNNYSQHGIGALFKLVIPAGETRIVEGTGVYDLINAYVYEEGNIDGNCVTSSCDNYIVVGNSTDATQIYYVWIDGYADGEYQPVTVDIKSVPMVSACANALIIGQTIEVTADKTQVGYLRRCYGDDIFYMTEVQNGAAYYVDIPANSAHAVRLHYVGETVPGYWDADYDTARVICYVQDSDCVNKAMVDVSKYSDIPNYEVGKPGRTSVSYMLINDSNETERYYIIVTNVENKGDVELSVNEITSINTLVDDALDITDYGTYEGEFSEGMYSVPLQPGISLVAGRLVKQTLAPGESIDVSLSANVSMNRYELVDGKLRYINTYSNRNTIINNGGKTVTYYYWLYSDYVDIKSYTATVGAPYFNELAAYESVATSLKEGDNALTKTGNLVGLEVAFETWNEEIQDTQIIEFNEEGYIYKFNVPAMSEVTVKLTEGLDSDNVDVRIFDGFDAETQAIELMGPSSSQYGDQTQYTYSNVSSEDKNIAIFLPKWRDECGINISVKPLLPEDDGTLYIYSWNDEIQSRIAGVLEAYPEYKEKIKCINFNVSGTGDEYINAVKSVLDVTKDKTAIVVMDIDVVGKLKAEEGFANLEDVGFDTALYDNAYDYTVEMGTYEDELKFVTYEAHPGGFIYNMDIAKEVLGTSDPEKVQAMISDPEKFLAVAEMMKDAGYYMTSGEDTISNLGRYTFNEDEAKKLSQNLSAGGYTTGNRSWSVGWTEDMMSGEVFGFFASPWFVYWTFQYTDIPVAICEGPVYYPWGGCFLGVSSDGDNENDALAAQFLELLCCDEEVIYNNTTPYISDTNGGVAFPNNQKVVERFISEDIGYTTEFNENATITNNPMPVWHNASNRIGKGEWESKCTDKKYVVTVDSKKQIDLSPDSEAGKALLDAGFVYENFTKLADVEANASYDATTGVLTVEDVKKVVRYIYTENGVSRELQFIACMEEDTSVKVQEDVVEDIEKGETTTTFIEVDAENGEIVGQIDEVEVKTEDDNTTIVVTENKDIFGDVVEDASITVSQETISESTLDQSIDVAVEKNESYAQAAEENDAIEEKVEIKEIKAEFKDDSANTEVSKDLINKLQDKDMSLEISKKNDKGDVEYSWHFDRHSMKDVDKDNVKPVNTKVTIHTDDDLKGYDKDKKDQIDKLTKKDDSEKPVEKSVIAFDHNGELPGKTTVTLNVGDKYEEGSYVYYYHYDDKDKDNPKLVPKGRGKVKDGYVPVRIDHCSDYVITNEVLAKAESATLSLGSEVLGESTTLETGDTAKLSCIVAPEAAMQDVTYSSSDTRVLTVDENGNIEAVAEGTAVITATANDDSGVSVCVTVTVKNPIHLIARITLDKTAIELEGGEIATVKAKIIPEIATDKTVTWSSEDESVAVVDENGNILALKEGTTTITVTANDEGKKSASCQVTVTKSVVEVTEIKLDSTAVELDEGEDVTFAVTVLPEEATIKGVIWTSSDETVATVDATGKVTAVKEGTATITAQATDGSKKSVSCEITVKKPIVLVSEIKLDNASLSLEEGASKAITATVKPTDATDRTITWKSSDETIATVDATGKVTAVKEGTATITAQAADGSKVTAECKVTVSKKVIYATEVSISNSSLSLVEGETSALIAKVAPSNATNNAVNWSSNNTSVATVDKNGKITAIKAGVAVITATAADGSGKAASCKITVVEPEPAAIDVTYHTHIQTYGDTQGTKKNGEMAGTSGKSKRLENIWIKVDGNENLGVQYSTHCQTYGWMAWSCNGETNGTSGEAKRLEAIKIQLTGADKDKYDIYYRVHAQSFGWLGWAKNGEPSGTAGYAKRLEGIQVVVVKKGEAEPGLKYAGVDGSSSKYSKQAYVDKNNAAIVIPGDVNAPIVSYKTHVQSFGWQKWVYNGAMSGTEGKSKRLEGINIKVTNCPYDGDIVYTTHVQKYGWKDGKPEDTSRASWKKNGEMSGTSGEAKRLEAICIDLTGEMAEHYDVYYRVHAQSYGWLGWAKNGECSGTAGYAKRLEGIQIILVPKGESAPANNYGGITSKRTEAYIHK